MNVIACKFPPKASAITLSAISAAASGVSRPRASAKDAPAGACPADFQTGPFSIYPSIKERSPPTSASERRDASLTVE